LNVQFKPSVTDSESGILSLTDNARGNPQTIYLAGTGVQAASTTTTLTAAPNPAIAGQKVTLSATVAETNGSGVPTGTVTFLSGATSLGTGTLSSGRATYSTSSLDVGSHSITASYGGDASNLSSTSTAVSVTIALATPAAITTPTAGSTLTGPSVAFTWPSETGATLYYLSIGSTGVGSNNLFNTGWRDVTSWTATGLPANGETVYVRITTDYNGLVAHNDTTYSAAKQAVLTTPTPGATLSGSAVTFDWNPGSAGATLYELSVGSTGVGSANLYISGWKNETSQAVTGLPTNGVTLYVRLSTDFNGIAVHTDYTYTAQ
jgi:hypothetical protein